MISSGRSPPPGAAACSSGCSSACSSSCSSACRRARPRCSSAARPRRAPVRLHAVGQPDALDRRQHQPVEHAGARREHADHGVGMLAMRRGRRRPGRDCRRSGRRRARPVRAATQRAERRLERRLPQPARGQLGAVVLGIGVLGADDPEAREAVAERQRDRLRDQRMAPPSARPRRAGCSRSGNRRGRCWRGSAAAGCPWRRSRGRCRGRRGSGAPRAGR